MKKLVAVILVIASAALLLPGCMLIGMAVEQSSQHAVQELADHLTTRTQAPVYTEAPEQSSVIREEIVLTKDNFDEYINGSTPILVDFWASWCGPCMRLAPTIAEVAAESDGSYLVGKVNIDEQPELASRFGVDAIPTLIVFQNGEVINRSLGLISKEEVLDLLK